MVPSNSAMTSQLGNRQMALRLLGQKVPATIANLTVMCGGPEVSFVSKDGGEGEFKLMYDVIINVILDGILF